MKLLGAILLVCFAQAVLGDHFSHHQQKHAKRTPVRNDEEETMALKRPTICRTQPRICEKIRFKICSKACVTPKRPSCCARHIATNGDTVTLRGRGLCFTQGYIKRNFRLTIANPNLDGKDQARGNTYLFMCPIGTDLLATASRRAAPSIEKNWPKMVAKMTNGEVGYFGVRTSSWTKKSSKRSPTVNQLVAYTDMLLAGADKEEINEDKVGADYSEDKLVDYMMSSVRQR